MFLDALGAEAGNMAIRYQASGGVYIAGGGIANKLLDRILDGRYDSSVHASPMHDSSRGPARCALPTPHARII